MDGHRRNLNFGTGTMTSSVDQIKSKIDIVTLVSSYIKLEKAGGNYKGRCPFHNEKSPSFFVSPDRGNYYCFGCHAKGDIFTFVQEFEGLDFIGSLKVLAEKAGVVLDNYDSKEKSEKERLLGVMEQACFFYQKKLDESPEALLYIKKRGLTEETVKNFRIGFAPLDWRQLHDFLISKGASEEDMLATGLIKISAKEREQGESATGVKATSAPGRYDTFRGRIMFPINDSSGRVVGFSGRILIADDKSPKYLNSPETVLFNKSEILFGLDKAKKDIRLKDYSILVEGQMDLVMLHQVGITNTVASSGTALSIEHLTKLNRLSNRIIIAYDGDSAGFSASDRSSKLALSLGMELKIAQMPEGKDPADMALENKEELINIIKNSKHIIDYYVDTLVAHKLEARELGQQIRLKVLPYVQALSNSIEKSHFIKNIAQRTFIKEEAFWDDLKNTQSSVLEVPVQVTKSVMNAYSLERRLLGVILWQKNVPNKEYDVLTLEKKVAEILGEESYKKYIEDLEKDREALFFEIETYYNGKNFSSDIDELLVRLKEEALKKRFNETMIQLQKAEQTKDSSKILEYLEICQNISQELNHLKQKNEK